MSRFLNASLFNQWRSFIPASASIHIYPFFCPHLSLLPSTFIPSSIHIYSFFKHYDFFYFYLNNSYNLYAHVCPVSYESIESSVRGNWSLWHRYQWHKNRTVTKGTRSCDNAIVSLLVHFLALMFCFFCLHLQNMNKQYVGNDFTKSQNTDKLTPEKVRNSPLLKLFFLISVRDAVDITSSPLYFIWFACMCLTQYLQSVDVLASHPLNNHSVMIQLPSIASSL